MWVKLLRTTLLAVLLSQIGASENVTGTPPKQRGDQYIAEGSEFFPTEYRASVKFPDDDQESRSSAQTASSEHLDDIDEKTAIDIILAATKSGRNFDVGDGTDELSQVTSDPRIRAQIANGNEAQARGYIKEKLCDLGLMPVSWFDRIGRYYYSEVIHYMSGITLHLGLYIFWIRASFRH